MDWQPNVTLTPHDILLRAIADDILSNDSELATIQLDALAAANWAVVQLKKHAHRWCETQGVLATNPGHHCGQDVTLYRIVEGIPVEAT